MGLQPFTQAQWKEPPGADVATGARLLLITAVDKHARVDTDLRNTGDDIEILEPVAGHGGASFDLYGQGLAVGFDEQVHLFALGAKDMAAGWCVVMRDELHCFGNDEPLEKMAAMRMRRQMARAGDADQMRGQTAISQIPLGALGQAFADVGEPRS